MVVSDGLKTPRNSNVFLRRTMKLAGMLCMSMLAFVGCSMPVSRTTIVPKDIAKTPEELEAKLELLKIGMELSEVFALLDIKRTTPGVREIVNAEEKQRVLYGATQVVGSPQELEQFRDHLGKHRILEIRFRDIKNGLVFDSMVSVVNTKAGPDFVSYLIFYDGKLINSPCKPDNFYQEESTRTYLSDLFGSMFRAGAGRGMGQIGN